MPVEANPRSVFERLFGSEEFERDPVLRAKQRQHDQSMFDVVLDDARRLQGSLGATDRRKLDEYLFSVRDIEKRIVNAERDAASAPPDLDRPAPGLPGDFVQHTQVMFDLMTVAFQTDLTRIITFMFGTELSNRVYRAIGISEADHGLTHHRGDPSTTWTCPSRTTSLATAPAACSTSRRCRTGFATTAAGHEPVIGRPRIHDGYRSARQYWIRTPPVAHTPGPRNPFS